MRYDLYLVPDFFVIFCDFFVAIDENKCVIVRNMLRWKAKKCKAKE